MRKAVLIHGWSTKKSFYDSTQPTASNSHWFPWVSKQMMVRDIHSIAPEMPRSFYPEYEAWKKELERFEIDEQTILIGHSCGGGFLVRWLSENPSVKVGKVVLVAPWMGIRPDQDFDSSFFDFTINPEIASQTRGMTIYNSDDDVAEIQESVELLRQKLHNIRYREFSGYGHFTIMSMGTEEFPELVEEVV